MVLGLTQHLTEMSTRNSCWGDVGRCVRGTTLSTLCPDCLEIWEAQLPGTLRAFQAYNGITLPLPLPIYMRLGTPQGRSGRVLENSPPSGFDLRNVQPLTSRYTE
jgi:hypothetical protein